MLVARDRLLQRGNLPRNEWLTAKEVVKQLIHQAMKQFRSVATELTREIGTIGRGFGFSVSGGPQDATDGVRELAVRKAGQTPDFGEHNGVARSRALSSVGRSRTGEIGARRALCASDTL